MSKRGTEEQEQSNDKKLKLDDKKEEIAIDSELLGQQSSYGNNQGGEAHGDRNGSESENNVNAAAAAVAAATEPASAAAAALSSQQHHHNQQLHQQLAYQNAFRQQHLGPEGHQGHQDAHHQHSPHLLASALSHLQPTTLPPSSSVKPSHGSEEWHKQRRENHKEVERRRRESINQGIKELAALIPTNDTNKSQILQRAVEYIKRLKENENNNIEKWTLEKLLTEQAVSELSASNEKLKQELERAYREIEQWKKLVKDEKK